MLGEMAQWLAAALRSVVSFLCCYCCTATSSQIYPSVDPHTTVNLPSKGSTSSLSEISSRTSRALSNSGRQVDALVQAEEGNISETHTSQSDDPTLENNLLHDHEPTPEVIFQPESESEELSLFPTKLHEFINLQVIPGFERQRQTGRVQFAVLLLVTERSLDDINHFVFEPHDSNGQPLVNNTQPYWPNYRCLGNYMVARPRNPNRRDIAQGQHTTHSEILLLQQLPILLRSFGTQELAHVILYSWFMPCPDCTAKIISDLHFGSLRNTSASVMVIYTTDWYKISQPENEASRTRLTEAGIAVQQIMCHKTLPNGDSDDDDYNDYDRDYDDYDRDYDDYNRDYDYNNDYGVDNYDDDYYYI